MTYVCPRKKGHSPQSFIPMLYVLYVHITKAKPICDKPILSSEKMIYKDYDRKVSVAERKGL
jgi:hypothetical protein